MHSHQLEGPCYDYLWRGHKRSWQNKYFLSTTSLGWSLALHLLFCSVRRSLYNKSKKTTDKHTPRFLIAIMYIVDFNNGEYFWQPSPSQPFLCWKNFISIDLKVLVLLLTEPAAPEEPGRLCPLNTRNIKTSLCYVCLVSHPKVHFGFLFFFGFALVFKLFEKIILVFPRIKKWEPLVLHKYTICTTFGLMPDSS